MKKLIVILLVFGAGAFYFWSKSEGKDNQVVRIIDSVKRKVYDDNVARVNKAKNLQGVLDNAAAGKTEYLDSLNEN